MKLRHTDNRSDEGHLILLIIKMKREYEALQKIIGSIVVHRQAHNTKHTTGHYSISENQA
ncbi:hypothetical protein T01_13335 [Trichinella spiralis]|uniref:Uncharacterized protein n=1 Tax=Trichinella spiralis TaxID=6334 RepID=A0A0V1AIC6_TRISP|nr:hypothetical protein T01_13335 [Trichinella spiralis]